MKDTVSPSPGTSVPRITIRVDADLYARIEQAAGGSERTIAQWVRQAIRQMLDDEGRHTPAPPR